MMLSLMKHPRAFITFTQDILFALKIENHFQKSINQLNTCVRNYLFNEFK